MHGFELSIDAVEVHGGERRERDERERETKSRVWEASGEPRGGDGGGETDVIGEHLLRGRLGGDLREIFFQRERALPGARTTFAVVMPTLFPTLATVANRRNLRGKKGVIISTKLEQSYTTELVNRKALHVRVKLPTEVRRHGQLTESPETVLQHPIHCRRRRRRRVAPRPTAWSICCVAKTVMHHAAAGRCANRKRA